MTKRIITAVVAFAILLPFLIFSETDAFVFLACLLSFISTYELLLCTGLLKKKAIATASFALALIVPALTRAEGFDNELFMSFAFETYFLFMIVIFTISVFSKGNVKLNDVALLTMLMVYVTFGFSSLVRLRDMKYGGPLYIMALIMPWVSDTFAYFTGRAFGRHKLIPDVSPKKTVEGAIGAVVCTSISVVIYGFVCGKIFDLTPKYLFFLIIGIVLSVVAQCGDLIMSLVKRIYGIKDFGKILPGHGGILDRFDSTVATASLLYLICEFLNVIAFR